MKKGVGDPWKSDLCSNNLIGWGVSVTSNFNASIWIYNNVVKETATYPKDMHDGSVFLWSINVLKVLLPISSYYLHTLIMHPHLSYEISWIHLLFVHLFVSIIKSCEELFSPCRICNFHGNVTCKTTLSLIICIY